MHHIEKIVREFLQIPFPTSQGVWKSNKIESQKTEKQIEIHV